MDKQRSHLPNKSSAGGITTNMIMENTWIKVEDRLPENRTKVLFSFGGGVDTAHFFTKYINEHIDASNVFKTADGGVYRVCNFKNISWMPLPEPPTN